MQLWGNYLQKFKVFDSQILPILEYGSQLWYKARQNHRLETFHLGYLKRTIGLRLQTPTDAVLSDTGRFSTTSKEKLKCNQILAKNVKSPSR